MVMIVNLSSAEWPLPFDFTKIKHHYCKTVTSVSHLYELTTCPIVNLKFNNLLRNELY